MGVERLQLWAPFLGLFACTLSSPSNFDEDSAKFVLDAAIKFACHVGNYFSGAQEAQACQLIDAQWPPYCFHRAVETKKCGK